SQPKLRWLQIVAISIFYFSLNFQLSALLTIIVPSQVFKMVGDLQKGEALAFVLIPGAFVALFSNPLFGLLSDHTRGKLAIWGRRRPYILIGTLVNVLALLGMAAAPNIPLLAVAYILVQFSSNPAQAPFHALLPDIVPAEQRGLASGVMGLLLIAGNIAGVIIAGIFVDATLPLPIYQQHLWLTYGVIMIVLIVFMLITIVSVSEGSGLSAQLLAREAQETRETPPFPADTPFSQHPRRPAWLTPSLLYTVGGTIAAIALLWGLMTLWNSFHLAGIQIGGDVQQVILEIVATLGILRLFDFHPRRDPDFAWVLLTRLVMMLGIYTIQTFLQYYMHDVIGSTHPEQDTRTFVIFVSITSLISAFTAGWLSDRIG